MTAPPTGEKPVYVEFLSFKGVHATTDDGTPIERKPLRPSEVWVDYDSIPDTAPAPAPFPGNAGAFATGILEESLVQVPGNPHRFTSSPPSRLALVIPAYLKGGAYRPVLQDADGKIIDYSPGVWVVDGIERVIEFKFKTPTALGYRLPLKFTYWTYTGAIGGSGPAIQLTSAGGTSLVVDGAGPLLSIKGVTSGAGIGLLDNGTAITVVNDSPATSVQLASAGGTTLVADGAGPDLIVKGLTAGAGIALTDNGAAITVVNDSPATSVQLASAGGTTLVADGAGPDLIVKGLTAGAGIGLTDDGTAITVVNDSPATSVQLASAGGTTLVADGAGPDLAVKGLTAGTGIGLLDNGTDITISGAAGGLASVTNVGAGTGQVFDAIVSGVAWLRTLAAGTRIAITQTADTITISAGAYVRTPVNVATYTILASDDIVAVTYTLTGNVTLTLPQVAGLGGPKRYAIVDEGGGAGAHPITIMAAPGDTIVGNPQLVLENSYNSVNLYHNGASGWFIS